MNGRRQVLFLVAVLLTVGAGGVDPALGADLEANKDLVRQFAEAQNNGDFEALAEILSPDLRRHSQATPEVDIRSSDEFIAFLKSWLAVTPDARQTIHRILAEGDLVAVHATFSGTQTGVMGDIPPTGKSVASDFIGILRIADGRIAEIWVEWDNVAILSQLGVFPPPTDP